MNTLTFPEYQLLVKAHNLKQVDEQYKLHWQAYLNFAASAKKRAGKDRIKPVFARFDTFFDYEAELDKARGIKKDNERLIAIGKIMKQGKGETHG